MESNERISVVIPVYNEAQFIAQCLSTLESQIVKPYEIIVVDNNSTDNTVEIVKKYNVKVIHEPKQGITHARNAGFNAARGDIVARCDADTRVPPDWIENIAKDFADQTVNVVGGRIVYYDLPMNQYNILLADIFEAFMRLFLRGNHPLIGVNLALRKNAWEAVQSDTCVNDHEVHEDIDLSIHLVRKGFKIFYDKDLIVETSGRRIKKRPQSFFLEYPWRLIKTILKHI
jgi:glycosyltransferase involved in cell wall biosynthesis